MKDVIVEPMSFEHTLRRVFGEKKANSAGAHQNRGARATELRRLMRKLIPELARADTAVEHRDRLIADGGRVLEKLSTAENPSWGLVYALFGLVLSLLGRTDPYGRVLYTPSYWQTKTQRRMVDNSLDTWDRERGLISVRREIVKGLRAQGYSDFEIAIVLETSEHDVKRLRHE